MSDYPAFNKIPRLYREITVTEKIDGTNGLVSVERHTLGSALEHGDGFAELESIGGRFVVIDGSEVDDAGEPTHEFHVRPGSRNRWLTLEQDNAGFARWVGENAEGLAELGPGLHYGEWWGSGIQRRYGQDHKRFSLFNAGRWEESTLPDVPGLGVVPIMYQGEFRQGAINMALDNLAFFGSRAAPGFMAPEGVVVYHSAGRHTYKVLLENDSTPKGSAA